MHFSMKAWLLAMVGTALAAPAIDVAEDELEKRAVNYPFNRVIAFGDSFVDNGNGSYGHCKQAAPGDCSNKIYGAKTWTNGPVAVSYLVDMLGVPLVQDYAWGWARGAGPGNKSAATIKQSYNECPLVQSGFQQVANFTGSAAARNKKIDKTLMFLWIGNIDIQFPHFTYPDASDFGNQMADYIETLCERLLKTGAPHVFVPGYYNKHIAPFHQFIASKPEQRKQMGQAIRQANNILSTRLYNKFGGKVIYYDVYSRMMEIWTDHNKYGITKVGNNFCDGDTNHPNNFNECIYQGKGDKFYWVNYTDPTTRVHYLVALDMLKKLRKRFA